MTPRISDAYRDLVRENNKRTMPHSNHHHGNSLHRSTTDKSLPRSPDNAHNRRRTPVSRGKEEEEEEEEKLGYVREVVSSATPSSGHSWRCHSDQRASSGCSSKAGYCSDSRVVNHNSHPAPQQQPREKTPSESQVCAKNRPN